LKGGYWCTAACSWCCRPWCRELNQVV
jgi:hypothetical protein